MQLHRLISLRDGQRRVVTKQLEKLESGDLTPKNFRKILRVVSEKAEAIKVLNEKILNHNDVEDIVAETEESEEYSISLDLKIDDLTDMVNEMAGESEQTENRRMRTQTTIQRPEQRIPSSR